MNDVAILVRCIHCKAERSIAPGEISADDVPMCQACYSPMVPVRAVSQQLRRAK